MLHRGSINTLKIPAVLLFFAHISFAQNDTGKIEKDLHLVISSAEKAIDIAVKPSPFDTNYVRKYKDRLVLSVFQSKRKYDILLEQQVFSEADTISTAHYIAQANNIIGFGVDYDKISFSIGFKSPVTETNIYKRGKTNYSSYNFSFTGSKYRLETSYRRYQGFYDQNTGAYDTTYTASSPYYQNPSLSTRSFKVKGFYFMNRKRRFSYSSSYSSTSRQLKTAGSFLLVGNVYSFLMKSNDGIIPPLLEKYYGPWIGVNYFNLYGLSVGPGYTFNLVLWKRFFLNLTLTLGVEARHRYFSSNAGFSQKGWNVSVAALDARTALGYNAKNFFISFTNINDLNSYNLKTMSMEVSFISGAFNIGYRFPLKEYKPIKMVKENKIYKMF